MFRLVIKIHWEKLYYLSMFYDTQAALWYSSFVPKLCFKVSDILEATLTFKWGIDQVKHAKTLSKKPVLFILVESVDQTKKHLKHIIPEWVFLTIFAPVTSL